MLKWLGATLIVGACCAWGLWSAFLLRRQETELRELLGMLEFMENELSHHQTPLPELFEAAGKFGRGAVAPVILETAEQLRLQKFPDAVNCMRYALSQCPTMAQTRQVLELMGRSIGRFDLDGQCDSFERVKEECTRLLLVHCDGLELRMRTYRILGLCAGGTLAILLL